MGVLRTGRYWSTIREYESQQPVPPKYDPQAPSWPKWEFDVKLPNGVTASIWAHACPMSGCNTRVKYSDEPDPRVIHGYSDYIYPADLRLKGTILYAKVDGVGAGIWRHTRIIIVDLSARKKLRDQKVDYKDLKSESSGGSSKP